jgi:hypothetical protein
MEEHHGDYSNKVWVRRSKLRVTHIAPIVKILQSSMAYSIIFTTSIFTYPFQPSINLNRTNILSCGQILKALRLMINM